MDVVHRQKVFTIAECDGSIYSLISLLILQQIDSENSSCISQFANNNEGSSNTKEVKEFISVDARESGITRGEAGFQKSQMVIKRRLNHELDFQPVFVGLD